MDNFIQKEEYDEIEHDDPDSLMMEHALLEPDDFQHVMDETGRYMNQNFLHDADTTLLPYVDSYPEGQEEDSKLFSPSQLQNADSTQHTNPFMSSTGSLPAREDYPGPCRFSVLLDGVISTKNKWVYSTMLNKLYIIWDKVIPMQFKWVPREANLVVRALAVYTEAQDMKTPVQRCMIHSNPIDSSNLGFKETKHVIRSDNPGAIYDYNPDSKRTSLIVPLGELQPGTGTVTVTYKFMCKTSCVTGMMRRPITVLFTLERLNGEVIGRQKLNVKVCCCPRRDMEKDEESTMLKQEDNVKRPLSPMEKAIALKTNKKFKSEFDPDGAKKLNIEVTDPSMFSRFLEANHGVVTSLLRTTHKNHFSYNELTALLNIIERKLVENSN